MRNKINHSQLKIIKEGNKTMDNKKRQVQIILNEMSKIKDRPLNKDGGLDVGAFNKLPEVVRAKKELKEIGADRTYLNKHFFVAGIILN